MNAAGGSACGGGANAGNSGEASGAETRGVTEAIGFEDDPFAAKTGPSLADPKPALPGRFRAYRSGSPSQRDRLATSANATTRPLKDVVTLASTGVPSITGHVALIGRRRAAISEADRARGADGSVGRLDMTIGWDETVREA